MNEADTCRHYVLPKLLDAGWDASPHSFTEQRTFTDGRIIPLGNRIRRGKQKRADYLLRYTRDFLIAVIEAKADYKSPSEGIQQAKDYAEVLGLKFAYATNGTGIVEFDFITGKESNLTTFPSPAELWQRYQAAEGIAEDQAERCLEPYNLQSGEIPRYYQDIAINLVVKTVLQGKRRVLLTMATGTGKTMTAFQICWKLWNSRWNLTGDHRRPKILYLADREILVEDPMLKDFAPFGDALHRIQGDAIKSREMYFATYQAIAEDERRLGLYKEYAPDFFDLVVIDECHRGSARADSTWREMLNYFKPAAQLGMTATPLRDETRDTYRYFGNPIYTYSLRQGIEDGFLAPYRVRRVVTSADAAGWRPDKGERDRLGREIPDEEYHTKDFERTVVLRKRTEAIAKHLTNFLKSTDRFAKTLVFCVDQEHAQDMRQALVDLNTDLMKQYPNYVCRVTSDEGNLGKRYLSEFQDIETVTPTILTSSQLLTTGVNAKMVKVVVIARVIGSMSEFKQIIGRGTRVQNDYGKFFFTILDYTGSATRHFADPAFDGDPARIDEEEIDEEGNTTGEEEVQGETDPEPDPGGEVIVDPPGGIDEPPGPGEPRKFYVDGGNFEIAHEFVQELDADGKQLRCVRYTDYTAEKVRNLFPTATDLREPWSDAQRRQEIIDSLEERGISFEHLAEVSKQPNADPFDLLCHVAYNAPLRTRRERADRVRKDKKDFFDHYGPEAQAILNDLLDKYADHGLAQFKIPDVLKVPPISERGNVGEIVDWFGGADNLKSAVNEMQSILYAA